MTQAKVISEPTIRGDVEFDKVEEGSDRAMPNVVFRVTSTATGETHLVMTDEQGHFSSRSTAHSQRTNELDAAMGEGDTLDESKLTQGAGIWFYGYQTEGSDRPSPVDDARGSFPAGTYRFEELRTTAAQGHGLCSFEITINDEGSLVSHGAVSDPVIGLETSARDAVDQDKYLAESGKVAIEDIVSYSGLTPNQEYLLTCSLHHADTGDALVDSSGGAVEGQVAFTPSESFGQQTVSVDLADLPPDVSRIVAYERLTQDGQLVASHEDPLDPHQTLYVPRLSTTLIDQQDGDSAVPADAKSTLDDTVSYRGLIPGQTYQIVGRLVDRSGGEVLKDADGKEVTSSTEFTPATSDGEIHVLFEVNGQGKADHSLVAMESLMQDGRLICSHDDLDDPSQTVSVVRRFSSLPNTGARSLPAVLLTGEVLLSLAALGAIHRSHTSRRSS